MNLSGLLCSWQLRLLVCTALIAACAGASNAAQVSLTEVNVRSMGAKGDGKADDTAAFEKAIAATSAKNGTIKIPMGRYRITRPLALKGQTLLGAQAGAYVSDEHVLPTILVEAKDGPCVSLKAGGSVHGIQFWYDWGTAKPSPRPACIELAGVGCRVSDTKIFGAWDGIMADGTNNVGRALIQNCFLVNIHNIGVRMTGTWDSSWISKVEVWSPGSENFPKNGIGFQLGKNDMLIMSDCFVFTAHTAYQFADTIKGCKIKGGTWGTFSNCTADYSSLGVVVDGNHTVSFVGGTYWTHFGGITVKGKDAQVRISGLELGSNGGPALNIEGGDLVAVSGCQIRRIFKDFDTPALKVTGGESVVITGCVVKSSSTGIDIPKDNPNVVFANNIVRENVKPQEAPVNIPE
ncbi:MAG: right-handed parallel beta-helix repeat-containing protein [Armatimonadota bacterium]